MPVGLLTSSCHSRRALAEDKRQIVRSLKPIGAGISTLPWRRWNIRTCGRGSIIGVVTLSTAETAREESLQSVLPGADRCWVRSWSTTLWK